MNRNTHAMLESIAATNSGATLENYLPIHHDAGYQYSTTENGSGNSTDDIETAAAMIDRLKGTCGVWYDNGIFYVETSYHAATLENAMNAAKKARQLTIYDWKNDTYIPVE